MRRTSGQPIMDRVHHAGSKTFEKFVDIWNTINNKHFFALLSCRGNFGNDYNLFILSPALLSSCSYDDIDETNDLNWAKLIKERERGGGGKRKVSWRES